MKLYRLGEIPTQDVGQVFKAPPSRLLIPLAVFIGIVIALLLVGTGAWKIRGSNLPPPVLIYIAAAIFALFGLFAFLAVRASLKQTNWLLQCDSRGLIIKFRSYLNWRFPAEDFQAVAFDYSEVAWIRTVKERRTSPSIGSHGSATTKSQHFVYLDFCLANFDLSALEKQLQAERMLTPAGLTIFRDYPVEVLPDGIVRVRWNGISPSSQKALGYLGQHVKIAGSESTTLDLTHHSGVSPGEEDAKILKLARSGDKMAAVQLARQIHGFTLTEAVAFVDKLLSGG
jgi:hypothetical protein